MFGQKRSALFIGSIFNNEYNQYNIFIEKKRRQVRWIIRPYLTALGGGDGASICVDSGLADMFRITDVI